MKNTNYKEHFYGHGKVLLSSEYYVLDGASALALPTQVGQSIAVKYKNSFEPRLYWKSYDHQKKVWFEAEFEFWHFNCLNKKPCEKALFLEKVFKQVRKQNSHFLRDEVDVHVDTFLEFPKNWGLGSSSTLINNIAKWAYVSPFELQAKTLGGSGYDVACAQVDGPLLFQRKEDGPSYERVEFNPVFKDQLYFIYLGNKTSSTKAIYHYQKTEKNPETKVAMLSDLTMQMLEARNLDLFERIIATHEDIISSSLNLPRVKELHFSDYWGEVKSLGAWGGDFALVTSNQDHQSTKEYFLGKGLDVFIPFEEMILQDTKSCLKSSLNDVV